MVQLVNATCGLYGTFYLIEGIDNSWKVRLSWPESRNSLISEVLSLIKHKKIIIVYDIHI